jgi:outer membrane protein OmpA-like peptidoglycan-associated protein
MRTCILPLTVLLALCACSKGETAPPVQTPPTQAAVAIPADEARDTVADAPAQAAPDLLSFANGTIMPARFEGERVTAPILMIDGAASQNWVGDGHPQSFVFELPQTATIRTLEFDNDTGGMGGVDSGVRELTVEVSDASASDGYREIFSGTLEKGVNGQRVGIATPVAGRWLRANFRSNHGGDWFSLAELRAFGDGAPTPLSTNVGGAYANAWGTYNVVQDGTAIRGCFRPDGQSSLPGAFSGGIEGNVAKILYVETDGDGKQGEPKPALLVFDRAGTRLFFAQVNEYGNGLDEFRDVPRSAAQAGDCGGKRDDEAGGLADTLERKGRVTVYGINFDFNSANLRAESKTVLREVADLLQGQPDLRITIEGHTDDVGGETYNQTLSDKRAGAVKDWLVRAGIDAGRLRAEGKGAGMPIASNATDIGRAQNRRVELARQ